MNAAEANPLAVFFHAVMNELRKRLTPAEFAELLSERDMGAEKVATLQSGVDIDPGD